MSTTMENNDPPFIGAINFEDSMTEACNAIGGHLSKKMGLSMGKNLSQMDYLPNIQNVLVFHIGGGVAFNTWNFTPKELYMNGHVMGRYDSRERAQRTCMSFIECMPILFNRNIQVYRIREDGMPDIETVPFVPANGGKAVRAFEFTIETEIVFNTTQTYT